ncbi:fructuronate reductase [Stappia sp. GBMRC 2046]|uniref:Fructuronate reductase n=1 Tax=Stappia sediminis TaxID=2692190 RepID=A0A7X3LWQ8_9HYPH|nr:mannitol dehydrogenase family protein [Stappia sediminis]MXN66574.1 fructuronate reductase [Stappia sediminis]
MSRSAEDAVLRPSYDRNRLKPRILHIGFGAFVRAHLLVYLDEILRKTDGDWGVCAVRLNSGAEELTELDTADHLYTVAEVDDGGITARTVGAVVSTCHPKRDGADALFARFEDPDLSIVSLTITEKGYCQKDGELDPDHKGIQADLASPEAPGTAVGYLVEGLRRRKESGLAGVTLLSCDNLPNNGAVCRAVVQAFAERRDPALARWIARNVSFPSTMVDRIVPALDDEGRAVLHSVLGDEDDPNGIVCEPFRQWVIEDDFAAGRPDFELAGAQFTDDVRPFEEMKLRMLNGSHSFIAYLGALAGHQTVSACMNDDPFRAAAFDLMMKEQAPTLSMPEDVDLDAYARALIARFSNSRLKHRTTQIASDGSQKLPQRFLESVRHHMRSGADWPRLALGIAGWMAYCRGRDDEGNPLPLNDPLAEKLTDIAITTEDGTEYVREILERSGIFPPMLSEDTGFRTRIADAYKALRKQGARNAVAALSSD